MGRGRMRAASQPSLAVSMSENHLPLSGLCGISDATGADLVLGILHENTTEGNDQATTSLAPHSA